MDFHAMGNPASFQKMEKNTKGLMLSWTMGGFHYLLDQD